MRKIILFVFIFNAYFSLFAQGTPGGAYIRMGFIITGLPQNSRDSVASAVHGMFREGLSRSDVVSMVSDRLKLVQLESSESCSLIVRPSKLIFSYRQAASDGVEKRVDIHFFCENADILTRVVIDETVLSGPLNN